MKEKKGLCDEEIVNSSLCELGVQMKDGNVGMKGGDVGILHMEAGHESLVPVQLLLGSNARQCVMHNDAGAGWRVTLAYI